MRKFFYLLILLQVACKKEVNELPAATQIGANTFGATVNGVYFVPQGVGIFPADNLLESRFIGNDLIITARNFSASPNEREMELYIKDIKLRGVSDYLLNTNTAYPTTAVSYGYFVKRNITPENEWITSSTHKGVVSITKLDTIDRIVSGNFHFEALNLYNNPEPLTVAQGRFDIKIP